MIHMAIYPRDITERLCLKKRKRRRAHRIEVCMNATIQEFKEYTKKNKER